jgi:hypothetical protein
MITGCGHNSFFSRSKTNEGPNRGRRASGAPLDELNRSLTLVPLTAQLVLGYRRHRGETRVFEIRGSK